MFGTTSIRPRGVRAARLGTLAAAAALALVAAPGCRAFTVVCRGVGLCQVDTMTLPPTIPPDFAVVMTVDGQSDPPADYKIRVRRDGTGDFTVVRRSPVRSETSGKLSVLEDKMEKLYAAVNAAEYPTIASRFPDDGDGSVKNAGVQSFSVTSLEFQKQVQSYYTNVAGLDGIRKVLLAMLPEKAFAAASPKSATAPATSAQVVGDMRSMRFYAPDSPLLKDVPANQRQTFPTHYAALDFGYQPSGDWRPPQPSNEQ